MQELYSKNQNTYGGKVGVFIFVILSIFLKAIAVAITGTATATYGNYYSTRNLIFLFLSILPYMLFWVYALFFHQSRKAPILYSLSIMSITLSEVYYLIQRVLLAPQNYNGFYGVFNFIKDGLFTLPLIIFLIFSTVDSFRGLTKKAIVKWVCIISIISGVFNLMFSLLNMTRYVFFGYSLSFSAYLLISVISTFSTIFFYIALWIFAGKNSIKPVFGK